MRAMAIAVSVLLAAAAVALSPAEEKIAQVKAWAAADPEFAKIATEWLASSSSHRELHGRQRGGGAAAARRRVGGTALLEAIRPRVIVKVVGLCRFPSIQMPPPSHSAWQPTMSESSKCTSP